MRGFRAVRGSAVSQQPTSSPPRSAVKQSGEQASASAKPVVHLGETLFGVRSPPSTGGSSGAGNNPFATTSSSSNSGSSSNPFAPSAPTPATAEITQQSAATQTLSQSFAQKARLASPGLSNPPPQTSLPPQEPWPAEADFPTPYPSYHIDAETEYLEPESTTVPSNARLDTNGEGSSSAADDKVAFESTMDKTFQRFADRLAQNPEQILRYEFGGQPLLYSATDAVGRLLSPTSQGGNEKVQTASSSSMSRGASAKLPRCANCGSARVFEMQLTPHAITELEAEELGLEGMDWGTVILGVCGSDCQAKGTVEGEVEYAEEWVAVQWEELASAGGPKGRG